MKANRNLKYLSVDFSCFKMGILGGSYADQHEWATKSRGTHFLKGANRFNAVGYIQPTFTSSGLGHFSSIQFT